MLTIARKKMKRMALNIPILDGDMRDFKTTETFEVVLSMYDSINYLLNPDDLKRAFTCVHKALQPGGIFIFDICTEYNSLIHFSDDYSEDTINGIWFSRHTFYRKRDRIQFNDFRIREKNGDLYQEFHRQRVYKQAEIRDALLQAGFSLDGMFAGYTVQKPRSSTDRIHFVARRGK